MRNLRADIVARAEHVFDHHGFTASGMDRLTQAADVSSRTLYKHVGNKNALIASVLEFRSEKFFDSMTADSVDKLFENLEQWTRAEGARGCLFLRAQGEGVGEVPEIAATITAYRSRLRQLIDRTVAAETDERQEPALGQQILVLFEGATAAASYLGADAISSARTAARILMKQAR